MVSDFSVLRALAACLTWSVASSSIIFLNKYIMDVDGFRFPMALSCLGMTTSSICSYVAVRHLKVVPQTVELSVQFWFGRALPIGVFGALTLYFGNLAYLYISVSYIQMLKGMTPIITLVVGVVFGIDSFTVPLCASLVVIAFGVGLASWAEAAFAISGFLAMLAAECAEAGKVVLMQKLMAGNKLHVLEGLLCFSPPCALSLFVGMLILELDGMLAVGLPKMAERPHLYLIQGCMGFVVNLLILLVIKTTSSVTFKVVSMMKNVAVVVGSVPLFGNQITLLQAAGYAVSMGGFIFYQWARSVQPQLPRPRSEKTLPKQRQYDTEAQCSDEDEPLSRSFSNEDPLSCVKYLLRLGGGNKKLVSSDSVNEMQPVLTNGSFKSERSNSMSSDPEE